MTILGDPHNFGRRVSQISSRILLKPRNLFWEWQFLSSASALRQIIQKVETEESNGTHIFTTFPSLSFQLKDALGIEGGEVEMLVLDSLTSGVSLQTTDLENVGRSLALISWFGITDLHSQNMMMGYQKGRLIFCPVDIECVLEDYYLLSQAHLLPSENVTNDEAGMRGFWKRLSECNGVEYGAAALCHGYVSTLEFLLRYESRIFSDLASHFDLSIIPSRVIVRPTRLYSDYLKEGAKSKMAWMPSEKIQLERGDIPYFFRKLGSSKLLEFKTENCIGEATLDDSHVEKALETSRLFKERPFPPRKNGEKLLSYGFVQLARAYSRLISWEGEQQYQNCKVVVTKTDIKMQYGSKLNLSCAR